MNTFKNSPRKNETFLTVLTPELKKTILESKNSKTCIDGVIYTHYSLDRVLPFLDDALNVFLYVDKNDNFIYTYVEYKKYLISVSSHNVGSKKKLTTSLYKQQKNYDDFVKNNLSNQYDIINSNIWTKPSLKRLYNVFDAQIDVYEAFVKDDKEKNDSYMEILNILENTPILKPYHSNDYSLNMFYFRKELTKNIFIDVKLKLHKNTTIVSLEGLDNKKTIQTKEDLNELINALTNL